MNIDFRGQVVVVTGGTRGIGKQTADEFAALGADVIVTGRTETNAGAHRLLAVDFTENASTDRFLEQLEKLRRVDVLVNNAGINRLNPVDQVLDEDWKAIRAVNLDGPLRVTRTVSHIMKRQRYGRIVNVASIWSVISKPKRVLYSMSKFGVRGLTVSSAIDLAAYGILVNTVSPGFVNTELTRSTLSETEMQQLAAQVPLGRFAEPTEIAKVILFLASRQNTYLTGQNIVVDGGFVDV